MCQRDYFIKCNSFNVIGKKWIFLLKIFLFKCIISINMLKTALVIDNSAAITNEELSMLNIQKKVPISFVVNGEEYYEGENLSYEKFYQFLRDEDVVLSTSQPSIELVKDAWRSVLKNYDELVYIILSSGLSDACNTAVNASHLPEFDGKVFVVNNQRVSYMNKIAMYEASHLIKQGKTASQVKDYLEQVRGECGAYIAVNTLKHLKKGGRITPAVAAIGKLLNIKPILQVHGGKLDSYAKVMSERLAKSKIISATRNEILERFPKEFQQGLVSISIAHTFPDLNSAELVKFKQTVKDAFPECSFFVCDPLPLFIACHTGENALAVGYGVDRMQILPRQ